MRILNGNTYTAVESASTASVVPCEVIPEGEETGVFHLPHGYTVRTDLEPNQSTSVTLFNPLGQVAFFWNSGTFVSCYTIGAGAGLMVTTFARNPLLGALAGGLVAYGCSKAINRTYEDGDTYIPPC